MSIYTIEPSITLDFEIIPIGRDPLVALINVEGGYVEQLRLNGVNAGPCNYAFLGSGSNVIEVTAKCTGGTIREAYAIINDIAAGCLVSVVNI
ncbi:MAG: hypothetical protein HY365_01980 [Candidatus Aenigmarchaeota archaeon]|nr:hypothetical protein [Candidatus Aenigmarchaeota archaeon]